jgi:hypothetical protein
MEYLQNCMSDAFKASKLASTVDKWIPWCLILTGSLWCCQLQQSFNTLTQ